MGDFKLKIDIPKPDVDAAERGLKSIFNHLDKIDKKAKIADARMRKLGSGGANTGATAGGAKGGKSNFLKGLLGGVGFGTGAAGIITSLRALESVMFAVADAAKKAAVEFGEFQNNIVSISRISGIAEDQIVAMSDDFLKLSADIPVSAKELQGFAEIASRFGIKGRAGVQAFAETFGRLQSIIGTVSEETTKSVARIANLTNFPITEIDKFANAVVVLGKNFATTEDQIIRTGERIAGDTSQFGVTADQVLGLATAFDALGIKAELGGSAMVRILNSITKAGTRGGSDLERLADIAGSTSTAFRRLAITSPIAAFEALVESGGSATEIMDRLNLSGVRVQGVLGRLTNRTDTFKKAMSQSRGEIQSTNVLMGDAKRQAETLGSSFDRISNVVTAAFIKMGESGNEQLKMITDDIIGVVQAFAGLDDEAAKKFPGIASLGETLNNTFSKVLETINAASKGIDGIGKAMQTALKFADPAGGMGRTIDKALALIEAANRTPPSGNETGRLFGGEAALRPNAGVAPARSETSLDVAQKRFNLLENEARKLLPDILAQTDKYVKKSKEIDFANANKGLGATDLRLAQLRNGFEETLKKLDVAGLALTSGGLEAIKKLKDEFAGIESGLLFSIALEDIEDIDDQLDKINERGKALVEQKQDLNKGPAPDVNAITSITAAAEFIADSKRADKESQFRKQQLDLLIVANRQRGDLLRQQKKDINTDLAIGNFRNRP